MTTKEGKKPAKLVIVVIYLCCLSLLLGLGTWQLMRGLEKAGLERVLKDQAGQEKSFDRKPGDWNQYRYSPVALTGRYLPGRYFLLDNRIYKGQPGYEILSPFVLSHDHGIVLVNRGWIPKTRNPEPLAETVDSGNDVTVSGQLYIPEKGFMFVDPRGSAIMIDLEKQIFLIVLSDPGIRNPANKSFIEIVNNLIDIIKTDIP